MKVSLLSVLFLATTVACQGEESKSPKPDAQRPDAQKPEAQNPETSAVLKEVLESFKTEHIKIDAKARTVSVPVVVNHLQDPIEYLLIHRRGKKHESVFVTESKPSILNAALLMIGLQKGKNATFEERQPAPTLEEVQNGADPLIVTPPEGKPFYMTVKWTTPEKKVEEYCVEDLILDLTTQEPLSSCNWIYLGGRMGQIYKNDPEVYVADLEGNLVSVCYLSPDNHLGTMSHERARDDQNWWTTTKLPVEGTEMEFIFHAVEPVIHVQREKRLRAEAAKKEAAKKDGAKKGAAEKPNGEKGGDGK